MSGTTTPVALGGHFTYFITVFLMIAGLFIVIPPDPATVTIREFAILYAIVGVLLFFAALTSAVHALLGNRG